MFKFGSKSDFNVEHKCTIRLLDDDEVLQCVFHKDQKGFHLLDYVCEQLNLVEKDFFGLRYVDNDKQRHWLEPARSILKQIKGMHPIILCFRVKFYPQDPHKLIEEITRYQIFQQLRRDLLHGRLYCSQSDSAQLAAYIIQSELGDYDPDEHVGSYVSDFKMLLKQTVKVEEKIKEIHQTQLKGQVPSTAESNFLRKACLVDTYGVDPHPVKKKYSVEFNFGYQWTTENNEFKFHRIIKYFPDQKGNQLYIGVNHAGILTFQGSRKTHHFKWVEVQKLNYEGKMFIIHLSYNEKKHTIGFKCPSSAACKHVWRCAVEQRIFFTLSSSAEVPSVVTGGSFFSRGSRFRYSGRVEKEILESNNSIKRDPPDFSRNNSRSLSFRDKSGPPMMTTSQSSQEEETFTVLPRAKHSTPILIVDPLEEEHLEDDYEMDKSNYIISYNNQDNRLEECDDMPMTSENEQIPIYPSGNAVYNPENNMRSAGAPISAMRSSSAYIMPRPQHLQDSTDKNHISESVELASATSVQTKLTGFIPLFSSNSKDSCVSTASIASNTSSSSTRSRQVVAFRLLFPTLIFAVLFLSFVTLVILESESDMLSDVRRLPELIVLRREYYEPFKEYVKRAIDSLFNNLYD